MELSQFTERTLVILKPDAVQRGLVGKIIARFEDKGLKIVGMKLTKLSVSDAERFYEVHRGKEFYEPLVRFMTSAPVVAMVLDGKRAIEVVRKMLGETFGPDAPAGTIRGDWGLSNRFNLVHASDSAEAAQRETPVFFNDDELLEYRLDNDKWIYDLSGTEPV